MAQGDRYELVVNMVHSSGEPASAVFYMLHSTEGSPVGDAEALNTEFEADLIDLFYPVMSDDWTVQNLDTVNLDDDSDWDQAVIGTAGDLTTSNLPPVCAVSFRSPKQNTGFNRSGHRLPFGVAASMGSDGSLALIARDSMYFVQQQLGLPTTNAAGDSWSPVTVAKTYVDGELVTVTTRATVTGQWELNRWLGTQKGRQTYAWQIADEPV